MMPSPPPTWFVLLPLLDAIVSSIPVYYLAPVWKPLASQAWSEHYFASGNQLKADLNRVHPSEKPSNCLTNKLPLQRFKAIITSSSRYHPGPIFLSFIVQMGTGNLNKAWWATGPLTDFHLILLVKLIIMSMSYFRGYIRLNHMNCS